MSEIKEEKKEVNIETGANAGVSTNEARANANTERSRVKQGRRGKRKADVVRPGPLYQILDAIITIAGLALIGAIILYVIMIFG